MRKKRSQLLSLVTLCVCYISTSYSQGYQPPQEDCDKYCFAKCDKYLERETAQGHQQNHAPPGIWVSSMGMVYFQSRSTVEFTDCVTANRYCDCGTHFTIRNPVLWLGLFATAVGIVIFLCYACKKCQVNRASRRLSRRTPVAHPVEPSVNTICNNNNAPFRDWYRGADYESPPTLDAPPEYVPPPGYYDILFSSKDRANSCEIKSDSDDTKSPVS